MKKIIYFLSALALLFFSACNNNNALPVPVTDIAFEPALPTKPISLTIGKTYQLKAKVQPDNATNKTLTYTSDNPTIASVNDKGVITAHKTGSAKITVQAAGGIAKDITVTITPKPEMPIAVRSIELSPNEDTISVVMGTSRQLNVQVKPENAADKKLSFSSSDEGIASINGEGLVTAKAVGNANITINAANGVSKILKVTVTAAPVAVTDIVFDPALQGNQLPINVGKTCSLHAKVQPDTATDKNLTYSSADETIASVNDKGEVTAHSIGETKITIKASNGVSKEITVKVTVEHIPVTGIKLSPDETDIFVENGNTRYISAHVVPDNATNSKLLYTSNDSEIASISDEGLISTHSVGRATITITAADNPAVSKKVMLTVTKATVRVTSIEFEDGEPANPVELIIGESYELKLKVMPEDAENSQLHITSSNENVAWPNGDGNRSIKAYHDVGTAIVTITSADNPNVKREVRFKTKEKTTDPSISTEQSSFQCESNEGDVTFTVKTINGKLDYTPEVVGGGPDEKAWITFVSKNNTNQDTDTVRLSLKQNKTVWDRTAYIKFRDNNTNEYIKSAGKVLEVILTQKKNENPNVTIKWVYGIDEPEQSEKEKILIHHAGQAKNFYWDDDKIFYWNETTETKWFNNRKVTHLDILAPEGADGYQCWAKTSSNMLHWWFVQNEANINRYIRNKTEEEKAQYKHDYHRGLLDEQEKEKSSIANTFRLKAHNGSKGDYILGGLSWYLYGNPAISRKDKPAFDGPALFKDMFSNDNSPVKVTRIHNKENFETVITEALNSKKAIGINIEGSKDNGHAYAHAITLWGAVFDEKKNIIAIYVVDNNFRENRIFPYGIYYKEGRPYLFSYFGNAFNKRKYVGEVVTLDKGEDMWEEWLSTH